MSDSPSNRSITRLAQQFCHLPLAAPLLEVLAGPTGTSSAGYPYLEPPVYEHFRDRVPHLLGMGQGVLDTLNRIEELASKSLDSEELEELERGARVVRVCVRTAAVTAPADLWLLRHVLATFSASGMAEKVLAGERLEPTNCEIEVAGRRRRVKPRELQADLSFLLSRGYLQQDEALRFVAPWHPRARQVLRSVPARLVAPTDVSRLWQRAFAGEALEADDDALLSELGRTAQRRTDARQNTWIAELDEIELGYRLLPVLLGLRAAGRTEDWLGESPINAAHLAPRSHQASFRRSPSWRRRRRSRSTLAAGAPPPWASEFSNGAPVRWALLRLTIPTWRGWRRSWSRAAARCG